MTERNEDGKQFFISINFWKINVFI
jgi:hypothetical protein